MNYEVSKTITGIVVRYHCPKCKSALRSALNKAGQQDVCPDCQVGFVVPGADEFRKYQAKQADKQHQKEKAKEEKRVKRELVKKREIEQRQQDLAEITRQSQRQRERKQQKKQMLAGAVFNPVNHDWSTGAPFVYDCIELGTLSSNWQEGLNRVINQKASQGWEYFRSESLVAFRNNGCLAGLFGNPTTEHSVVVLVFRKPTPIVSKELSVENKLH